MALPDGGLEGGQVYLVQGAVADDDVHLVAVLLIVVEAIVLYAGGNAQGLHLLHVGHHHAAGQVGVFAHVLEVASAQRRAVDVHAGAQYHVLAAVEGLLAKAVAVEGGHLGVPCGGQAGKGREGYAGVVRLPRLLPLVPQHVGAHAVRAVVRPEVGEAQPLDAGAGELALGVYDVDFLGERHAPQGILNARLDVL